MAVYTCYFRNGRGAITSFDFIDCDSDAEALTRADAMLARRDEAQGVEVVEGHRTLAPVVVETGRAEDEPRAAN